MPVRSEHRGSGSSTPPSSTVITHARIHYHSDSSGVSHTENVKHIKVERNQVDHITPAHSEDFETWKIYYCRKWCPSECPKKTDRAHRCDPRERITILLLGTSRDGVTEEWERVCKRKRTRLPNKRLNDWSPNDGPSRKKLALMKKEEKRNASQAIMEAMDETENLARKPLISASPTASYSLSRTPSLKSVKSFDDSGHPSPPMSRSSSRSQTSNFGSSQRRRGSSTLSTRAESSKKGGRSWVKQIEKVNYPQFAKKAEHASGKKRVVADDHCNNSPLTVANEPSMQTTEEIDAGVQALDDQAFAGTGPHTPIDGIDQADQADAEDDAVPVGLPRIVRKYLPRKTAKDAKTYKAMMHRVFSVAIDSHLAENQVDETGQRQGHFYPGKGVYLGAGIFLDKTVWNYEKDREDNLFFCSMVTAIWTDEVLVFRCLQKSKLTRPTFQGKEITALRERRLKVLYSLLNGKLAERIPDESKRLKEMRGYNSKISAKIRDLRRAEREAAKAKGLEFADDYDTDEDIDEDKED